MKTRIIEIGIIQIQLYFPGYAKNFVGRPYSPIWPSTCDGGHFQSVQLDGSLYLHHYILAVHFNWNPN